MIEKYDFRQGAPEIGIGVAETDARNFHSAFIRLHTYNLIGRNSTIYVAGRKGSGKSALCIEYEAKEIGSYSTIITMKKDALDYVSFRQARSRLLKNSVSEEDISYISRDAWQLAILINAMISICVSHLGVVDLDIQTMKAYLSKRKWYDFGRGKRALAFVAQIISIFTQDQTPEKISKAISQYLDYDPETVQAIKSLKSWLSKQTRPILFMIDDIDSELGAPLTEDERAHAITFCDALVNASQNLSFPNLSENFHLKVFIPQDLFGQINQRHLDKTRAHKIDVRWDKTKLIKMLVARLHLALPSELQRKWKKDVDAGRVWSYFFPERIYINVPGLKKEYPFPSESVVQTYTMQRPRDLVVFCDSIFKAAYQEEKSEIDARLIWDQLHEYSKILIDNIEREYRTVRVDIGDIIRSFFGKPREWERSELTLHLANLSQIGGREDCNQVIDILYDAGFLGIKRELLDHQPYPGRVQYREEFYYDRNEISAHENAEFVIHTAFIMGLNLVSELLVR
jgi:hypothetical protein